MPKGAVMQEELTKAATRLFQARGIRAVTLQEIAEEVGLTKAALYHYFIRRDGVLQRMLVRAGRFGG